MIVHVDPNPGYTAHVKNDETVHANVNWHSPGQPDHNVEPLSVTNNGTYTAPQGKAYSPVTVNVPHITTEEFSTSANGTFHAPSGKAYDPVIVNVPHIEVEAKNVTANGTYTAPSGKAYSPVTVNVSQPTIEALAVTSNGTYTAPSGKAYSPVTVNVPQYGVPSGYQEVEYLETTGQQWIALSIGGNATVTIDVSINALQESEARFSGAYSSSREYCYFSFSDDNKIKFVRKPYSGSETIQELITSVVANTRYQVSGVTSLASGAYEIGAYRNASNPFTGKIYRIKIDSWRSDPDTQQDFDRVLVPCYRKFNSKPGFIDIINGNFYTSATTYEFIVGPDVQ